MTTKDNIVTFPKVKAPTSAVAQLICPDCGCENFNMLVGDKGTTEMPFTAATIVCTADDCDYTDMFVMSWFDRDESE